MSRVKLVATEGMIYTNGESFGRTVFLGTGDNPDNWWEISESEYEKILEESAAGEDQATDADYQAALREMGVKL